MNRHSLFGWSGALAASALVMAACGGSTGTSAPGAAQTSAAQASAPGSTQGGSAADPCSLISTQEASAALGKDLGPGKPAPGSATVTGCEYGVPISGPGLVLALVQNQGARGFFDQGRTQFQANPHGATVQDLPGVGDAAYLVTDHGSGSCFIAKGSTFASVITYPGPTGNTTLAAITTLCRALGGRL